MKLCMNVLYWNDVCLAGWVDDSNDRLNKIKTTHGWSSWRIWIIHCNTIHCWNHRMKIKCELIVETCPQRSFMVATLKISKHDFFFSIETNVMEPNISDPAQNKRMVCMICGYCAEIGLSSPAENIKNVKNPVWSLLLAYQLEGHERRQYKVWTLSFSICTYTLSYTQWMCEWHILHAVNHIYSLNKFTNRVTVIKGDTMGY